MSAATWWVNDLPVDWQALELRRLGEISASNVDKITDPEEAPVRLCNYTDVYYNEFIDSHLEFMDATATQREIERFKLRGGEVLLTKDSETAEDIAIPAYVRPGLVNVICGYHLYVLRPDPDLVDSRFLMRACSVSPIRDQFVTAANGITRYGLGQQALGSARVPVPPLDRQLLIADFLDRKTTEIDRLIEHKERLIELLEEKRAAVITRVVTKGLDPDVEMRDSGVGWLGEIPAHWKVVKYKEIFRECDQRSKTGEEELLTVSHITGVTLRSEKQVSMIEAESHEGYKLVEPTNLAINTMWAWMGALGISSVLGIVSPAYNVYRFRKEQGSPRYFDYLVRIPTHVSELGRFSKGIWRSRLRLYPAEFLEIETVLPPREEQQRISSYLDDEVDRLSALQQVVKKAITLLREYRTALISSAVTGKIDIRDMTP